MILEKKQNMPKQKININKDNLIIIRNKNNIDIDTEESIDSLEINDMDDEEIIEKKPKSKKKSSKSNTITI
jgi:hypothetical protein